MDEGFIAELQTVTNAEIFLPVERTMDTERYANLDLSRETFAKVFKVLTSRNFSSCYTIFDVYQQKMKENINFDTFFVAFLVFKQLGLIFVGGETYLQITQNKNVKKPLTDSSLYNKLLLIKKSTEKN